MRSETTSGGKRCEGKAIQKGSDEMMVKESERRDGSEGRTARTERRESHDQRVEKREREMVVLGETHIHTETDSETHTD